MMSLNYAVCQSGQPIYTDWQQPTLNYVEWQQHIHAARQPDFQQPEPPCVGSEWYRIPQMNQFSYHPCQPPPNQPPDPLDWTQPYQPYNQRDLHEYAEFDHLPPPPPRYTPDSEPNLSVAALVSQLERLTADVEQLVSRMDEKERRLGDPQAATRPPPTPAFSEEYMAPVSCPLPQPTIAAPTVLRQVPSSSSLPAAIPPPPLRSSSCWSSTNPMIHCRSATPLPAAAAAQSLNLPPPAPPCSPDISGDEGELLDDDPPPPAVISQPGSPDTSPTLVHHVVLAAVPSLIKIDISEGVKGGYSSSSLGKRIVTEKFHNLDDIGFSDEANPIDGDVARMNHRPTSLDGDTRLIPPRKDTSCLSNLGRVEKYPVLTLNFGNHNGHRLMIFDGGDEGRCSTVRCAFDPGGDTSPKLLLLTLFVASWFPP